MWLMRKRPPCVVSLIVVALAAMLLPGCNSIAVGTGGARQHEADRLYADTIQRFGIEPFDEPHIHLKLWMERAWEEHDDPEGAESDLELGETGLASLTAAT